MRKKIVAGNWKMNKNLNEALELGATLSQALKNNAISLQAHQEVVICPPYIYLLKLKDFFRVLGEKQIQVGAQNCHFKDAGAYTGEISASMLKSLEIDTVILGHSERRTYFKEDNALLKAKLDHALANGLRVIFCCGETLAIRETKEHFNFVAQQLQESVFHLSAEQMAQVVIAYEPIWAIGTGVTAAPEQAEEIHAHIRQLLAKQYDATLADNTTILYGGSCKPTNADALFSQPNVDGGLIGGAALKADSFVGIIEHLR